MKMKKVLAGMMMCLAMASCIQDEALNVEAAIDGCRGKDIQQCLIDPNAFTIQLYVSKAADPSKINLHFELPVGATVAPERKMPTDGTDTYSFVGEDNTRNFKVTSEDGAFSATYKVTLWQTEMPTVYGFETLSSSTPYHTFYEQKDDGYILRRLEWASGNDGYNLTGQAKTPLDYPTVQVNGGTENGGKCVKLETKDTGSFGAMVGMHIAAGNLFIGSFELSGHPLNEAMKATHFGFPYFYEPKSLKGYYKYKAGPQFSVKGKIDPSRKDQCDIYGVLYETDDNVQFLDGTNSLTSPNIVALARDRSKLPETDEWKDFNFDFEFKEGKFIDSEKLENGIYKLAIVFSSSVDGANFEGAVGSTLYIDQVEIVNTSDSNN